MKNNAKKLLTKIAQEGIEIVPGNRDIRSMITPSLEEKRLTERNRAMREKLIDDLRSQELFQRSLENQANVRNLSSFYNDIYNNTDKKSFGGTTGRRTYSGPKKGNKKRK